MGWRLRCACRAWRTELLRLLVLLVLLLRQLVLQPARIRCLAGVIVEAAGLLHQLTAASPSPQMSPRRRTCSWQNQQTW